MLENNFKNNFNLIKFAAFYFSSFLLLLFN